jgi:hypothetical protein
MTTGEPPELTFDLAREIGTFPALTFTVTEDDVRAYQMIVGHDHEEYARHVPPGFACIFGRRSYLEHYRMPPGGILLKQDITWFAPAKLNVPVLVEPRVAEAVEFDGKKNLTMECTATQDGERVMVTRVTLRWPK